MESNLSKAQISWLVFLRIFIGWHFLYEGMVKVLNPTWSAATYLLDSKGWFGQIFINMAGNPGVVNIVDFLNQWGLILIGAGLLLGCFARLSCLGGMLLLLLYTMSHPALLGAEYKMPFEGSYFFIDKNLVEMAALGVLFIFPASRTIGLDRYLVRVMPLSFRNFII